MMSPPTTPELPPPTLPIDTNPPDTGSEDEETASPPLDCQPWPAATSTEEVSDTIDVSDTFDGGMKRFIGVDGLGSGSQDEGQPAFFSLADGAVMRNVILGFPAADGIHCEGRCTLENVWWEDVGEDAATFTSESESDVMTVRCGGARQAADKIFQHNGRGTVIIDTFFAEGFGKVYRSCGNCRQQFERHVEIRGLMARDGGTVAGINENFGDTATFEDVALEADIIVCELFRANDTGDEPVSIGDGPDAEHCLYQSDDIHAL